MRFFQSSSPLTLSPGGYGSIVVAYVFAAPVGPQPNCAGSSNCVVPGNPTFLSDPTRMANGTGASLVDTISGFRDWTDVNGDGVVEQSEFTVVNGSMLQKSIFAQTLFDGKFLLPAAPASPEFFLIPGSNQVTVMWQPSSTETGAGDPFFQVASTPLRAGLPNPFYDPSYIQNDVEGYRVYRGRVDAPNELTLLAQFDYTGTTINDYTGTINSDIDCAPEFALTTSCPGLVANLKDGTDIAATVTPNQIPLVGNVVQVRPGVGRVLLSNGTALIVAGDTAVTGGALNGPCGPKSRCPALDDTGVPFVYVDNTPRNNFRYFYSVTAFDVNSFQSGNSSLESARSTKSVTPVAAASNYNNTVSFNAKVFGQDGVALDTTSNYPTIDPTKGTFSGPMPPSNGANIGFVGQFVSAVVPNGSGALQMTLDSIQAGDSYVTVEVGGPSPPVVYFYTAVAGTDTTRISIPIEQDGTDVTHTGSALFDALAANGSLAGQFGGNASYVLKAQANQTLIGAYYSGVYGRGCVNGADGFAFDGTHQLGCDYNGARWFDGPSPTKNETQANPIAGNGDNFNPGIVNNTLPGNAGFNNGGALTGVSVIHQPYSYQTMGNQWRSLEGELSSFKRAADYNVYWSSTVAGQIDSVWDVTHHVVVPFSSTTAGASWGVLNQSAAQPSGPGQAFDARTELTQTDIGCVEPYRSLARAQARVPCGTGAVGDGPQYLLSKTVQLGPIAFFTGSPGDALVSTNTGTGFVLYMPGNIFMFQMAALPATGAVWSMRDYVGAIIGGNGFGGNDGPYVFTPVEAISASNTRPFSAVGLTVALQYNVTNATRATTVTDLKTVHTVPDPYYVTSEFEQTTDTKFIKFVNLPAKAIIRIYSSSGVLVNVLENPGTTCQNFDNLFTGAADNPTGGECSWNVRNRNNQVVASGVYFYHIESGDARRVGRFTVVNFAQ